MHKRNLRNLIVLLMFGGVLFIFVACGSNDSTQTDTSDTGSQNVDTSTSVDTESSDSSASVSSTYPWKIYVLGVTEEKDGNGWKRVAVNLAFENISDDFQIMSNQWYRIIHGIKLETEEGHSYDARGSDIHGPSELYPPGFRFLGYEGGVFTTNQNNLGFRVGEELTPSRLIIPGGETIDLSNITPSITFPIENSQIKVYQEGDEILLEQGTMRILSLEKIENDLLKISLSFQNPNKGADWSVGWGAYTIGNDGIIHWKVAKGVRVGPGQTATDEREFNISTDQNLHAILFMNQEPAAVVLKY